MDCILIGYGYWGHIIERYIRQSEKFRLLGICDHHKEDGVDLQAVIDSIACAFVCVSTRNHVPVVEELLALCAEALNAHAAHTKINKIFFIVFTLYIITKRNQDYNYCKLKSIFQTLYILSAEPR